MLEQCNDNDDWAYHFEVKTQTLCGCFYVLFVFLYVVVSYLCFLLMLLYCNRSKNVDVFLVAVFNDNSFSGSHKFPHLLTDPVFC